MIKRRQPAEWARHDAVFIGWPSAADLWEDDLGSARAEVEDFIRGVLFPSDTLRGEHVHLLARGESARAAAEIMRKRLPDPSLLTIHEAPIGDVWLRDTGAVFALENGRLVASAFGFNGWGGKYALDADDRIAEETAAIAKVPLTRFDGFIGEGGALETDGEGTFITTRQCLLNPNRNPGMNEKDVERVLKDALGAEKTIWLDEGLLGDHTDGHVDNLARFVAPGKVVCMRPYGDDDPNAEVLAVIEKTLRAATDAAGRKLEVFTVPSPGLIAMDDEPTAASHMNFYIANHSVVLPVYAALSGDDRPGHEAAEILQGLLGRPHLFAVDSSHVLTGGGSFHCISQQVPAIAR